MVDGQPGMAKICGLAFIHNVSVGTVCLCFSGRDFLVLRDNFFLNHLPRFIVKWVNNIYVCAISRFPSRHEKKIAFFCAVGESKAVNHKAVIQRNSCICLDTVIVAKTNVDARDSKF